MTDHGAHARNEEARAQFVARELPERPWMEKAIRCPHGFLPRREDCPYCE